MKVTVIPGNLAGEIMAIPSKSVAHRALICAALAQEPTKINNLFNSADILATKNCLNALKNGEKVLNCNESGSTLRFMLPVALAVGGEFKFKMEGRLSERPLSPLWEELEAHGCTLSKKDSIILASGKLKSGVYNLPGNISSQFITGLLLALPILEGDSEIRISGEVESAPYVDITTGVQKEFGVFSEFKNNTFYIKGGQKYKSAGEITIEGDWSNAAFWFAADELSEKVVNCFGVSENSHQGDREIVNILKNLPCEIDAKNIPDLVPIICAVAAVKKGKTIIWGAKRLAIKESNRLQSVCDTLSVLGADISLTDDGMIINGKEKLSGGEIDSFNDHRIAMMAAIASIKCEGNVIINTAEAVNKSYPAFFEDFKKLGGKIVEEI